MKLFSSPRSLVKKWLLSYVIVVMLPVMAFFAMFFISNTTLVKQSEQFNEYIAQSAGSSLNNVLLDIKKLSSDIALSAEYADFLFTPPETYFADSKTFQFMQDLKLYGLHKKNVDLFYIYRKDTDTIFSVGGIFESRVFHQIHFDPLILPYEEWINMIANPVSGTFMSTTIRNEHGENVEAVAYMLHALNDLSFLGDKYATIVITTAKSQFLPINPSAKWMEDCQIYIYDSKRNLVLSHNPEEENYHPPFSDFEGQNEHKGHSVIITNVVFDTSDWRIVSIVPTNSLFNEAIYLRNLSFGIISICLLAVGIIIVRFSRRNYRSVQRLMNILGQTAGNDEFEALHAAIEKALSENRLLNQRMELQSKTLKASLITRILKGNFAVSFIEQSLREYNIDFIGDNFLVMAFYVYDLEDLFANDKDFDPRERFAFMQIILTNIYEELLNTEVMRTYMVNADNIFAALINIKEDEPKLLSELMESGNYGSKFIAEHFHVNVTFAISRVHKTIWGIKQAYSEALNLIEYKNIMGITEPMLYEDIEDIEDTTNGEYYFSHDLEQRLMNCVRMGDLDNALELIGDFFDKIKSSKDISLGYAKCLMYDVIGSMVKLPDLINSENKELIQMLKQDRSFMDINNVKELEEKLYKVITDVCRSLQKEEKNLDIGERIIQYVNENYTNPNLNVSSVGEHFNLTAAYISKLFKESGNGSLLDYINKCRVEKAKELIKEGGTSLAVVAQRVGYSNLRTFNRLFKKREGTTPKMYK